MDIDVFNAIKNLENNSIQFELRKNEISEQDIEQVIVRPLLELLGWKSGSDFDIKTQKWENITEVLKDYIKPNVRTKPDFLLVNSEFSVIIEVKSPKELVLDHYGQPYFASLLPNFNAEYFGITNGIKFLLYEQFGIGKGKPPEQILNIDLRTLEKEWNSLCRLLSKYNLIKLTEDKIIKELYLLLEKEDKHLKITLTVNNKTYTRSMIPPWENNEKSSFFFSIQKYSEILSDGIDESDPGRNSKALCLESKNIGRKLFNIINSKEIENFFINSINLSEPGNLILASNDNFIQSLPWELLYNNEKDQFLCLDGNVDIIRQLKYTSLQNNHGFNYNNEILIHISSPEKSELSYEAEIYRLKRVMEKITVPIIPLFGTKENFLKETENNHPLIIHYSGHGNKDNLIFEDENGQEDPINISDIINDLKVRSSIPRMFYFASCYGNTPIFNSKSFITSTIVQAHQMGVEKIIGYLGPIPDSISTLIEQSIYCSIFRGQNLSIAVSKARRIIGSLSNTEGGKNLHWSQIVLFDKLYKDKLINSKNPSQEIQSLNRQKIHKGKHLELKNGFIGRKFQFFQSKQILQKQKKLIIRGPSGIGKSEFSYKIPDIIQNISNNEPFLIEILGNMINETNLIHSLYSQLDSILFENFGNEWIQKASSFIKNYSNSIDAFINVISQLKSIFPILKEKEIIILFDNLDSFLLLESSQIIWNKNFDYNFGLIWEKLSDLADEGLLWLVGTTRYQHTTFIPYSLDLPPLSEGSILRLLDWFPILSSLDFESKLKIIELSSGFPIIVEEINGYISKTFPIIGNKINLDFKLKIDDENNDLLKKIWENISVIEKKIICCLLVVNLSPIEEDFISYIIEKAKMSEKSKSKEIIKILNDLTLINKMDDINYYIHPKIKDFVSNLEEKEFNITELQMNTLDYLIEYQMKKFEECGNEYSQVRILDLSINYLFKNVNFLNLERINQLYDLVYSLDKYWISNKIYSFSLENWVKLEKYEENFDSNMLLIMHERIGMGNFQIGNYQMAELHLKKVLSLNGENTISFANTLNRLGLIYSGWKDFSQALNCYQKSLEIYQMNNNENGETEILGNLGGLYLAYGQFNYSQKYYNLSLAKAKKLSLIDSIITSLNGLGDLCQLRGLIDESIDYYEEAFSYDKNETFIIKNLINAGNSYLHKGEYYRSIEYFEKAKNFAIKTKNRPYEADIYMSLGNSYLELENNQIALDYYQKSLNLFKDTEQFEGILSALGSLGLVYKKLGLETLKTSNLTQTNEFFKKSCYFFEECLKLSTEKKLLTHQSTTYLNLAMVKFWMHSFDESDKLIDEGIKLNNLTKNFLNLVKLYFLKVQISLNTRNKDKYENFITKAEELSKILNNSEINQQLIKLKTIAKDIFYS